MPAAIGVGVGLGALLLLSLWKFQLGFAVFVAVALAQGAVEIGQALRRLQMHAAVVPIVAGTFLIVVGSYFAGQRDVAPASSTSILLGAMGLTVLAALIWRMPGGQEGYVKDVAASLFIIAYVPLLGAFVSLMLAGENGSLRVLTFIAVVVASDVGGYAVGVLVGRHPMAPRISPKKSWEGFAGSMVLGCVVAVLMVTLTLDAPLWVGLVVGATLVGIGVCGDLIESLIKRDVGIKDMSSILPGHGGVMDRLDSLLVAAPVAWLAMYLLIPGG
ncbi:phosphatidate cytidylyltransferase [Auraticoccus monumenti]|uniref:phosphatidate cytidylyltransferase n=1 Tax=Auraticoccus monumenti TaxID=675864 RepID=UPI001E51D8E1|nr:phosphatidate cytidylyltransferase [Auraticoccus monumenti]